MLPPGFSYHAAFIDRDEEAELLRAIEPLTFQPVRVQDIVVKRTAVHYGMSYDYLTEKGRFEPMPDFLRPFRARVAELAGVPEEDFVGAVVLRYPPGAAIHPHRDAVQFGEIVAGMSLRGACRLWLTEADRSGPEIVEQVLEPRSVYLLRGAARWAWNHAIPAVPTLRYSITFRQLRGKPAA